MIMKGKYQSSSDIFASCFRPRCDAPHTTQPDSCAAVPR
jgi:hypothetical protein